MTFPLLALGVVRAQTTPTPALLALSKTDMTLAIVDPATLRVVARVPSGPDPHEVIASTDGRLAFISNYGGGAYNTLTPIDLARHEALPVVDLGALRGPHGLTFVRGKVWFTAELAKAIGSYDPASKQIDFVLGTGQNRTHMIFVSDDVKRIITSNVSSATVTVIDQMAGGPSRTDWTETVIPVGRGSEGFDVTPNGREIWVANAQDGTISIIDATSKQVTQTLAANVPGANRLKFTPDGKLAFVSALRGTALTIFDVATRREVKRLAIGHGAAGIEMQPDGRRAYVACTPDNYVVVIDVPTLSDVGHIDVGRAPDGLAWVSAR